jgi:hypothetical protein
MNAGFAVAGTVTQFVPGTGETFEDLRYTLQQRPQPLPARPASLDRRQNRGGNGRVL